MARNIFLLLLPVFFVLHGYNLNYDAVPAVDAAMLALKYIIIGVLIAAVAYLYFKDITKAALFTLLLLSIQFFYGSIQDWLLHHLPGRWLLRYRFVFSLLTILVVGGLVWLKKRKRPLARLAMYLNVILAIFIVVDVVELIFFAQKRKNAKEKTFTQLTEGLKKCDDCEKPDIYFIIPDQYAGREALRGIFRFDNRDFIEALRSRGFHVAKHSSSNYNLTPFSVASTLQMNYIPLKKGTQDYGSVSYSYNLVKRNQVMRYLTGMGYQFYNCSIFDFDNQPANKYGAFLPYGVELITSQTLTARLEKDFKSDVVAGRFGEGLQKKYAYEYMHFNDHIHSLTKEIASRQHSAPKFVYTHLMMPHYPYYFDSTGNPLPLWKMSGLRQANAQDYIGYLVYTNKKLLELVDHIIDQSARPPVIVLLGDHGFRHPGMKTDPRYDFMNLNAVLLPNRDYGGFYDSISNVNHFRVLFNNLFHQQLPMLKDSTINVWPD
jgi:hypothetical protein